MKRAEFVNGKPDKADVALFALTYHPIYSDCNEELKSKTYLYGSYKAFAVK